MSQPLINLQTDLLRTFVSIIDLGSFTKAGAALGRTQPAISLQMRRLEELVGRAAPAAGGPLVPADARWRGAAQLP
jgi:DNA-binding transcriptional LysR family regulator